MVMLVSNLLPSFVVARKRRGGGRGYGLRLRKEGAERVLRVRCSDAGCCVLGAGLW